MPNSGQVLSEDQLNQVARRLFETLDMEERKSLSKSQCEEFFDFVRDTIYHKPIYVPKSEILTFEQRWPKLKKITFEYSVPDPANPKYTRSAIEERVEFENIWLMLILEARADGCLLIPFEETSKKYVEERERQIAAENDKSKSKFQSNKNTSTDQKKDE